MSDHDNKTQFDDKNLTNHDYDGIKEYDNPLPNWWLMTFFGTIIFAFIYYMHYEIAGGPTLVQELAQEMDSLKASQAAATVAAQPTAAEAAKDQTPKDEEGLKAIFADAGKVSSGKQLYASRCASCHGDKGQGLVGPNLTDNSWKNGDGSRLAILEVIKKGVLEKGMPQWDTMLKPDEILQVTAYVFSIKGTNVAGGKPPEGKEFTSDDAQK